MSHDTVPMIMPYPPLMNHIEAELLLQEAAAAGFAAGIAHAYEDYEFQQVAEERVDLAWSLIITKHGEQLDKDTLHAFAENWQTFSALREDPAYPHRAEVLSVCGGGSVTEVESVEGEGDETRIYLTDGRVLIMSDIEITRVE